MTSEITDNLEEMILSGYLKGEIVNKREGAYGVVYIVKQDGFPPYIAYKTTKYEHDPQKVDSFIREVNIWFRLKGYPLVLTPFYILNIKNRPFICMPYCEKNLRDYLNEKEGVSPVEALTIVSQILKGLIFARNRGIEAHQDLKPENILLKDLTKNFLGLPPALRWQVKIGDFGSANAWKELGKPYGTKPYMAPEQWEMKSIIETDNEISPLEKKVSFSKVDVFAVGVMLYELITGKHPIGVRTSDVWPEPKRGFPKSYKKDRKWKKWAKRASDNIKLELGGTFGLNEELEEFIKNMVLLDPQERLSLELSFNKVIDLLAKLDKSIVEQLNLLFDYYDTLLMAYERDYNLSALVNLFKIKTLQKEIIKQLLDEIKSLEDNINSASDAVYFCKLCATTADLLLKQNTPGKYNEQVEDLAWKILETATGWKDQIKPYHMYPEVKLGDVVLLESPRFIRDFEIYAEIIGYARRIFEKTRGEKETQKIFSKMDRCTKSAYWYSIASKYHAQGNELDAVKVLEKCIHINPNEALFYYMKALWLDQYLREKIPLDPLELIEYNRSGTLKEVILKKLEGYPKLLQLRDDIIDNAEKAIDLSPDWEEPKNLLERVERTGM